MGESNRVCVLQGIKPRARGILGKCAAIELQAQPSLHLHHPDRQESLQDHLQQTGNFEL